MPASGGPSIPTMHKIESGNGILSHAALTRLEHALRWHPDAAVRALDPDIRSLRDVLDAIASRPPTPSVAPRPATPPPTPFPNWTNEPDGRTPTGRRQQTRAARTRTALIAAAAHEFTTLGYTAASLNTILATSGSSKGALYFHFSCKAELADAVLTAAHDRYVTLTDRRRNTDPAQALGVITGLLHDIADAYTHSETLRAEPILLREPRFRAHPPSQVWETALRELATSVSDSGDLRPEFTTVQLARALTAALYGHCHAHHHDTATEAQRTSLIAAQLAESITSIYAAMTTSQNVALAPMCAAADRPRGKTW
ncbi:hypothetical protein CH299_28890 [Rhodococcus sp. 14-2686-1-2]|nr:hypothetical protein CH299_28890 [Rhodococcus sp. 14-2686-1-2]